MNAKIVISVGMMLGMAGCASTPRPNPALESAQTAVGAAEADPNVSKYAALDLDTAKKHLDVAQAAALHHDDAAIDQPAYLAAQTARMAQARADGKADDARVAAGQAERDKIQLDARSRDVATAKLATDTAVVQRDEATDKAARLQAEVDELKAKPTPRGLVLTLGDVLFDTGRAELNPGASGTLDQLPQRRADAVKSALMVRGIDSSRIGTEGYGKGFPVANNNDSGGRQLNRRV